MPLVMLLVPLVPLILVLLGPFYTEMPLVMLLVLLQFQLCCNFSCVLVPLTSLHLDLGSSLPKVRGARSQTSNSWSFIYFTLIFHSELKINLGVHSS